MTIEELETEALKLNLTSRARLASKLLDSLEALSEAEVERLWVEEAERRNEAWDDAKAKPAEEVLRDIRSQLG